jgi:hypothetical protein
VDKWLWSKGCQEITWFLSRRKRKTACVWICS